MDDAEELKKKKMQELQRQLQDETAKQEQYRAYEQQRKQLFQQMLTSEARSRLSAIRMARPDFARKVDALLIQLAQSGQIKQKITDEQLKQILKKVQGKRRETKIRRV